MGLAPVTLATERPFESDDWDLLLSDIEQHNVVPVVGPDLLIRGADPSQTLHQHLAAELVQRLRIQPGRLPSSCSLLDLCSHIPDRQRVQDTLRKAIQAANWPLPVPLMQLAAIGGLDLYVSTTFDSLLLDAVKQTRVGTQSLIYGMRRPVEDTASGRLPSPVVFQIFGRLDGTGDCALSEEEILEFTQRLHRDDTGYRPKHVFDHLARRNLLFLGCGFPGWLGRFLRRVMKVSGDLRDSGLFAHSVFTTDPGYVLFLERQGAKLWLQDSGVDFVAELYRRWRQKHPMEERASVFISYAREDQDVARNLSDRLERAGITVWFDRLQLRSGEIWNEEIDAGIQSCAVFVPIISRHSARTEPRFVHQEWNLASGMSGKRTCPLLTDLTSLPSEFTKSHARPLAEIDELVRDIQDYLEQSRHGHPGAGAL